MIQQQPQHQKDWLNDTRQGFDMLHWAALMVGFPVRVCTIQFGTWGNRFHGLASVAGFFWPLFFAIVCGRVPGFGYLILFWFGMIVLLAIHTTKQRKFEREGVRSHSRYWGTSRFERPDADLKGQESARAKANLVALAAGACCLVTLSAPLGGLLIMGAFAKMLTDTLGFSATRAQLREIEDARIYTETYANLYRQKNNRN